MIYLMDTAKVFMSGRSQAVRLPQAYRFEHDVVEIRRVGDAVLLRPIKESHWPEGFWDRIRIEDTGFRRYPTAAAPLINALDSMDNRLDNV